jgi:hypothetical protein
MRGTSSMCPQPGGAQRNPGQAVHRACQPRISSGLQNAVYARHVIYGPVARMEHSVIRDRRFIRRASPRPRIKSGAGFSSGLQDVIDTGFVIYGIYAPPILYICFVINDLAIDDRNWLEGRKSTSKA